MSRIRHCLYLIAILALTITLMSVPLRALGDAEGSGTKDDPWNISKKKASVEAYMESNNKAYRLVISGKGAMIDFYTEWDDDRPWSAYRQKIKEVIIEEGITNLGKYVLADLPAIKKVTIPNTVKDIHESAFSGCVSLENVAFEDDSKCQRIEKYAFYDCQSLKSMIVPKNVKILEESAFANCVSLEDVDFESGSSCETIGAYCFENCGNLKVVTIPDSLQSIGAHAFLNTSKLETVYFNANPKTLKFPEYEHAETSEQKMNNCFEYAGYLGEGTVFYCPNKKLMEAWKRDKKKGPYYKLCNDRIELKMLQKKNK